MPVVVRTYQDFLADQTDSQGNPAEGFRPSKASDKLVNLDGWWEDGAQRWAEFDDRNSDAAIAHFLKYCELRLDQYALEYGETRKVLHDQAALAARSPACAQPPHPDCAAGRIGVSSRDRVIVRAGNWW